MGSHTGEASEDWGEVQRCLRGDEAALGLLRDRFQSALKAMLLARGASATETEDILADLWADAVPGGGDHPALLEKFSGRCPLQAWLGTVATRRWIDLKRRQARRVDLQSVDREGSGESGMERVAMGESVVKEDVLVELLRASLQRAFAECEPEAMVLLRLVYLHGVTQRELMRMLGWHESKVSRTLSRAMHQIEARTLGELKSRDPWLELTWQDFLDLCQAERIGFA
jgi:RNA polymerase sigma factor (sigma-70 family)